MNNLAKELNIIDIEEELKNSYLDYAMSVIIGRALPDVRDGLKPVHRRILFAMYKLKNKWNKSYKKSARIVGDVIGKYHPHGDSAVYDAIVRMAQSFSLRYTLIDGQGNFGSVDGDSAAAMRYTEIRMSKITEELLIDIEKKTVNFIPNYDGKEYIPEVLPTKIPNLLINGSSGIAVGMATNIPPHNLKEVINGCLEYIKNKKISLKNLMKYIKGPDFPTSGIINGKFEIYKAYKTGKGKISIKAKSKIIIDTKTKKEKIIITELPYQVNKAKLIEKIAILIKEKKINGISSLRDESDKDGMQIVINIKKEAIGEIILNQLNILTPLRTSFGINMVALEKGKPKVFSLKKILKSFLRHRKEIITRRTKFQLKKAMEKNHFLEGMLVALDNIDTIIKLVQLSKKKSPLKKKLLNIHWKSISLNQLKKKSKLTSYECTSKKKKYSLTKKQISVILDLKIQQINNLEKIKIINEYKKTEKQINKLNRILKKKKIMRYTIIKELEMIKKNFGDKRKTKIEQKTKNLNIKDLITKENVIVTLSHSGYVKYQPISDYVAQKRGGKGKSAAKIKKTDYIDSLFVANTHDTILCFSNRGILYWMKVFQFPISSSNSRGKPIVNLLPLKSKERITTILPINEYVEKKNILMATAKGIVKKTSLIKFKRPRNNGIIAINLRKNDELIGVSLTNGKNNIMLFSNLGKVIQFSEKSIRTTGRATSGVRGIKITKNDHIVSLIIPNKKEDILTVTANGYGKRTKLSEFPTRSRSTQGVVSIKVTKKNSKVIGAIQVLKTHQIMLITTAGKLVRIRVSEIRKLKRNTQGVILIRTSRKEKVVALQKIPEINP